MHFDAELTIRFRLNFTTICGVQVKKELVPPFPIPFFDQLARLASAINIPANERVAADLSAEWAGGRGGGRLTGRYLGRGFVDWGLVCRSREL